jgi:hypothetical protein
MVPFYDYAEVVVRKIDVVLTEFFKVPQRLSFINI